MRRLISFLSLLAISFVLVFACKKSDDVNNATNERLIGKWKLIYNAGWLVGRIHLGSIDSMIVVSFSKDHRYRITQRGVQLDTGVYRLSSDTSQSVSSGRIYFNEGSDQANVSWFGFYGNTLHLVYESPGQLEFFITPLIKFVKL